MPGFENDKLNDPFLRFKAIIWDRVSDMAVKKNATLAAALTVAKRLYERSSADATKVSENDIEELFDKIDADEMDE